MVSTTRWEGAGPGLDCNSPRAVSPTPGSRRGSLQSNSLCHSARPRVRDWAGCPQPPRPMPPPAQRAARWRRRRRVGVSSGDCRGRGGDGSLAPSFLLDWFPTGLGPSPRRRLLPGQRRTTEDRLRTLQSPDPCRLACTSRNRRRSVPKAPSPETGRKAAAASAAAGGCTHACMSHRHRSTARTPTASLLRAELPMNVTWNGPSSRQSTGPMESDRGGL